MQDNMKIIFKRLGTALVILTGLVGVLLLTSFVYNKYAVEEWLNNPQSPGQLVSIGTHKLYATIKGEGSPAIHHFFLSVDYLWRQELI